MAQGALDAAPAGAHGDQVLARLAHAQGDALLAQRRGESGGRPGPVLAQQPVEGAESGTIVEVYQQGYRMNGEVIRPARVIVAA